jgi:hypothetical protein
MNSAADDACARGSPPAQSASTPHGAAGLHLDLRLVDEEELVVHQCRGACPVSSCKRSCTLGVHVGGV